MSGLRPGCVWVPSGFRLSHVWAASGPAQASSGQFRRASRGVYGYGGVLEASRGVYGGVSGAKGGQCRKSRGIFGLLWGKYRPVGAKTGPVWAQNGSHGDHSRARAIYLFLLPRARAIYFSPPARAIYISPPSRARATPARPRTRKPHGVVGRFGAPAREIGFSRRPTVGRSRNRKPKKS